MKSVLMSVKPKWCELIASGKKTVEVRKTRPRLDLPFKCYIYCTKAKMPIWDNGHIVMYEDDLAITNRWGQGKRVENPCGAMMEGELFLNGKVIGEFVCDRIRYDAEVADGLVDVGLEITSCGSAKELVKYAEGKGLYSWHISELVIYDKPKELSEFFKACDKPKGTDCSVCIDHRENKCKAITRPPQSWCYVDVIGGEADA